MAHTRHIAALLVALLTALAAAQQGVLTNGNSELPACAQTCVKLNQAATACNGLTSGSQSAWICFCQSAYLTNLASSDAGICDAYCTDAADSQQVSTWYASNCGNDHGASEHADAGSVSSTGAAAPAGTSTTPPASSSSSGSSGGTIPDNNGSGSSSQEQSGDWWKNHYKWIIMLIVLAITLPLLGVLMTWLRRRHDRRQDQIRGGFNAGITSRPTGGPLGNADFNGSGPVATASVHGSRGNSPARTREAFMPYGYAYSHSESRLGSRQGVNEHRGSPLAKTENEKKGATAQEPGKRKSRKVLVRDRGAADSDNIEMEKGPL